MAERLSEQDWQDLRAVCADAETTDALRGGTGWEGRALREAPAATLDWMQGGRLPAPAGKKEPGRRRPSAMIVHRHHQPVATVTLAELCREAGFPCPIQTDWPLRVERLGSDDAPDASSERESVHYHNLPDGSYSTFLREAAAIVDMLAYEAHEWQAWEVRRELRRRGGPHRFALLT